MQQARQGLALAIISRQATCKAANTRSQHMSTRVPTRSLPNSPCCGTAEAAVMRRRGTCLLLEAQTHSLTHWKCLPFAAAAMKRLNHLSALCLPKTLFPAAPWSASRLGALGGAAGAGARLGGGLGAVPTHAGQVDCHTQVDTCGGAVCHLVESIYPDDVSGCCGSAGRTSHCKAGSSSTHALHSTSCTRCT